MKEQHSCFKKLDGHSEGAVRKRHLLLCVLAAKVCFEHIRIHVILLSVGHP